MAVNTLKRLVTQAPVLAFYDPKKPVELAVDASQHGLGAMMSQDRKPIEFASRSLTDCETGYTNIEKEMLAVVFCVEHFHYYIYGRPITVESDHKPLEAIIKKSFFSTPPRLHLRMMKYDVTLKNKAGQKMYVLDTLSRILLATQQRPASDERPKCI